MKGVSRVTEQELVSAAKAGDQQAFEQLVLDNQNRIYSLAVRLVGDREEAFDLAQEAFVKAWQGLPSFQGESSFATWIYRLATNVCIDYLRKQKRRRQVESEVSLDDEELSWTEPADWSQDPHRQLERSEQGRALARGLEALPEQQRQILVLRELSGLSYQEIAEKLNLDLGTVKSRIARARMALRKILAEDGNFSVPPPSNQAKETTGR
ncbi:winged helix-turn-helix transcriptional regulator [Pseudoflavonifractor sp. AF19-9AC]|uniref:RNA polymerase sigma factor n=1 Tax=Pseudoflavonifractor sp. AF19-9AC TaxID=2292244 RepID=UPI000E5118A2|nr:sigma-70 family RNA polymerase sigma factor [Pseudoflavonifractor sp. AF19-9AC]RHR10379.1 winged helix-turn-helix transcriptional regulator [Pseudoflavonifractor sp. AF19-9AC]